jgi:hypothetical protein
MGLKFPVTNPQFVFAPPDAVEPIRVCDLITVFQVFVRFPWYNTRKEAFEVLNAGYFEIADQSVVFGGGDYAQPFCTSTLIALLCSLQQFLGAAVDPADAITKNLVPGDNYFTIPDLVAAEIVVNQVGPQVDRWYGGKNIAKLGVFAWGYPQMFGDLHFINCQKQKFALQASGADGCFVNLQPNCNGTITMYPASNPDAHPIEISFDGGISYQPFPLSKLYGETGYGGLVPPV